jgi:hypothetical protein
MTPDHGPRSLRRAVIALILTAVSAFAVVGVAAVIAAGKIAEHTALSEAERSAQTLGKVVFAPTIPAVLNGDQAAQARLGEAIRARKLHGGIARIKVWSRDGEILYSDAPTAVGRRFPPDDDILLAIDQLSSQVSISDLSDDENVSEPRSEFDDHLVEVYVPLVLDTGGRLCLEVYTTTARVDLARAELTRSVVTYALLSLLLLVVAQLPISIGLIRRAGRADTERRRLLRNALTASERERQTTARHSTRNRHGLRRGGPDGPVRGELAANADGRHLSTGPHRDRVAVRDRGAGQAAPAGGDRRHRHDRHR